MENNLENFDQLLEQSLKSFKIGDSVEGTVTQINGAEVILDIGYKSEAVIDISELEEEPKLGDTIKANIQGFSNVYVDLTRTPMIKTQALGSIEKAFEEKTPVDIVVRQEVNQGFLVNVGPLQGFMPGSQSPRGKDPILGKAYKALVIDFNKSNGRFTVSVRQFNAINRAKELAAFFETLEVDAVLKGTVRSIMPYGAFINLGVTDALVHITNMSWGHVASVDSVCKVGDELECKVISFDPETKKIDVSLKHMTTDPWVSAVDVYPVGTKQTVTVVSSGRTGYICEIAEGVTGFLKHDEMDWVKRGANKVKVGDTAECLIYDVDKNRRMFYLSLKRLLDNPWETMATELPEGTVFDGEITNITTFGLFIATPLRVEGLVHISDISWTEKIEDLNARYKIGDKTKVKVLRVDTKAEQIRLGIKQLEDNPWKTVDTSKHKREMIDVTVVEKTKNGVIVDIKGTELKGTIPTMDLTTPLDSVEIGAELSAIVVSYDQRSSEILLSTKMVEKIESGKDVKTYLRTQAKEESSSDFGNIFKDMLK